MRAGVLSLLRVAPRNFVGPVQYLHPPVEMFDQRGAAFYPIAIIVIFHAIEAANFGGVNMAAHHMG